MPYTTGAPKSPDDITIEDVKAFPIWEWALDEEGVDGQDETWQRPITSTNNVTREMFNPIITLLIEGTELYASGEFEHDPESIKAVTVWYEGQWLGINEIPLPVPLTFVSIPTINGIENIKFLSTDLSKDIIYSTSADLTKKKKWFKFW
jgi:hypothetical protein